MDPTREAVLLLWMQELVGCPADFVLLGVRQPGMDGTRNGERREAHT